MSQISGYKRTLSHANSIVVESNVPKFGVTSEHEEELAEVGIEIIKYRGPRIVPFYVLEKPWCNAKQYYAIHTL